MSITPDCAKQIMAVIAKKAEQGKALTDEELAARHYFGKYNQLKNQNTVGNISPARTYLR